MSNTNKEWIELCEYVKKNILCYDDNQKFPKQLALRLRGLERGTYMGNNNIDIQANYPYDVMLAAFKINRRKIVDYLNRNSARIKDERHKINIIMKIIEPEINDVYLHIKNIEKAKEIVEKSEVIPTTNRQRAEYKRVTREVKSDIIKGLWGE